ncbi:hypothetical protein [Treponema berlinense]|uniref:hypothetical protein n=1 Tax=Treponema berlinense TaxID=225004 RepID=UPI0026EA9F92|nr:hypothetical protein [Treponema berlinense]
MKKTVFIKTAALLILLSSVIFSCSFFTDSLNEPVKDYFKEYTETASVIQYKISTTDILKDNEETLCVPSYNDIEIIFYMINPQRFIFTAGNNMILSFPNLNTDGFSETEKEEMNVLLKSITLTQDETDTTILHLTYPSEFLVKAETGLEISPSIQLFHPVSRANFGTFKPLTLKSNSPPPPVYGAVVYKDAQSGTYVLCLNMPSKGMLQGIHRDVKTITIENGTLGTKTSSAVTLNDDGTFSFAENSFCVGEPDSSLSASSAEFSVYGQPATFKTGDKFSNENTEYIITLTDNAGLSASVSTSVYSIKLNEIAVKDKNGGTVSAGSEIQQDEGSSYATLTFIPSQTATDEHTGETKDTSDSQIVYEIYQGTDDTGKVLYNGKNSGGEISLKIPAGTIFLRVYAHKDLFADSKPAEFGIKVLKTTLFVSPDGSDTENNGSENSPYATISKAISELSDITIQNQINLLGNITLQEEIVISEPNANITISGNTAQGNFGITGNISSAGNLTIKDCTVNGSVKTTGNLSLCGKTSVTGGITLESDGLFIIYDPAENPLENVAQIIFAEGTNYKKGCDILKPKDGKTLTQEDCNRFTLASDRYVLKARDDGSAGYITMSGGSLYPEIEKDISFSLDKAGEAPEYSRGETITVKAALTDSNGTESDCTDDMTDWKITITNHGIDTGTESTTNRVTIPDGTTNWPADTYTVTVTAKYKTENILYSASFEIQLPEITK